MKKKDLKEIFSKIPENKRKVCNKLIESAVFMEKEIAKLEKFIAENGVVEFYQNGENQKGKKKSSEVEVYNTMIKNYSAIVKQLVDLLPQDSDAGDELKAFLNSKQSR